MTASRPELDIRWPIGLLFTFVGVLLALAGALSLGQPHSKALGINLNLWWGLAMALFGAGMLVGAHRASRNQP